jgi:GNAT superfamily N-acetyltransferase
VIRLATNADAPAMAAVQRAAITLAYAGIFDANDPVPSLDSLIEQWSKRLTEAGSWSAVSETGTSSVVGTIHLSPDGELSGFYVHPDRWGERLGAALYDAAVAHAHELGLVELGLWTLEANVRGRRYYERRGWRLVPRTRTVAPQVIDVRYSLALVPSTTSATTTSTTS